MGIGRAFEVWAGWAMDCESIACSMTKVLGSVGVVLGVLAAPFMYMADQNQREFEETVEGLDQKPTVVFSSVANCTEKGFTAASCATSQEKAQEIVGKLGLGVEYSSEDKCSKIHGPCKQGIRNHNGVIMVGQTTVITNNIEIYYKPKIVAWQAAASNLQESVPLYASAQQGKAWRQDGKTFDIK